MASITSADEKPQGIVAPAYDSFNEETSLIRPDLLHELFEAQADTRPQQCRSRV